MAELCTYQADPNWRIVAANEAFCRALRASAAGLIGRDVRDLIRRDWRSDFGSYVAMALVGAGNDTLTLPLVTPRAGETWFMHTLEAIQDGGSVAGYRAWLVPHIAGQRQGWRRWFRREVHQVWNFDPS
jgi:PAS domain-containing protein